MIGASPAACMAARTSFNPLPVLSTTTGIETVVAVLCNIDDPDDDAGDSFICKASHTDGDVTITAEQDDGATATEADTTAFYVIFGY